MGYAWPLVVLVVLLAAVYAAYRVFSEADRRRCEIASRKQEVELETTRLDQEQRRQALAVAAQTMAAQVARQVAELSRQTIEAEAAARVATGTVDEQISAQVRILWADAQAKIDTAPERARQQAMRLPIEVLERMYQVYLRALRKYGEDTGTYREPATVDEFIGWLEFTSDGGVVPIAEPKSSTQVQVAAAEQPAEPGVHVATAT